MGKIIHIPEPPIEPIRPSVYATDYPPGTRWMSDDNSVWEIDWDNQDKRWHWVMVTPPHGRSDTK